MTCGAWQATSPSVSCSTTITGAEAAGPAALQIVAVDAAGNAGFGGSQVTLDFSPPALVASSAAAARHPASAASSATAAIVFVTAA